MLWTYKESLAYYLVVSWNWNFSLQNDLSGHGSENDASDDGFGYSETLESFSGSDSESDSDFCSEVNEKLRCVAFQNF